ncbi:MAG: serine/threonine protein kinase [Deltaproteobacteria bacterium]|nr:serine/threonine protein kinase [Deltaproteobacteria bacterium]
MRHRLLGTHLALKLLNEGFRSDEAMRARFKREAHAAASVRHPSIVELVDYHIDDDFGPFLVMELLEGESLRDRIDRGGPLGLSETLSWIAPVARALDALHAGGLLHRDVKPANIVRAPAPGGGHVVKLVDFGLAIRRDGRDRVTSKGTFLGTPHYMAPEVATGKPESVASDIYSLAVTAYETLTGRVPYDSDSLVGLMSAKAEAPQSLETPTGILFSLPIQLAFTVALSADPQARPATACELTNALGSM